MKMTCIAEGAEGDLNVELVGRQAVIDTLNVGAELLRSVLDETDIVGAERAKYEWGLGIIEAYISDMEKLPSVQPEKPDVQDKCDGCFYLHRMGPTCEFCMRNYADRYVKGDE